MTHQLTIAIYSNEKNLEIRQSTFQEFPIMIGKNMACEIYLDDIHVSRNHAKIIEEKSTLHYIDLNSTNGSYIDGEPIQRMALIEPVAIELGSYRLTLTPSTLMPSPMEHLKDTFKNSPAPHLAAQELKERLYTKISSAVDHENISFRSAEEKHAYVTQELQDILGLGRLDPYLKDPEITEIILNGTKKAYVERQGTLQEVPVSISTEEEIRTLMDRILSPLAKHVDEASPMCDARLPDGSRINMVLPPISLSGPLITIRKFKPKMSKLEDWVELGTLSQDLAFLLKRLVQERKNIMISGGTSSGKTTLLNILSSYISDDERLITIEDAAELKLWQPHTVSLETRAANIEGQGEISMRKLIQNALRMRPDRLIIGECRGPEALDMLCALNTGHEGCLTTCHSNSPRDTFKRLETLALMADVALPLQAIRELMVSAIHYIVHLKRLPQGKRMLTDVVKVCGLEGDTLITEPIFHLAER